MFVYFVSGGGVKYVVIWEMRLIDETDSPKSKTRVGICLFTFGVCHSLYYTPLIEREVF